MLKGAVARRYARAIFDLAAERGELDRWLGDLRLMSAVVGQPRTALFMENPKVSFETKKQVVDLALGHLGKDRLNLLYLLISKRRVDSIQSIAADFEGLYNEYRGIALAEVTTAVPLNEAEQRLVAERLSQIASLKKVELQVAVDESLIGGVVARVGDRLIDGSVRGRLIALRQRLSEAAR